MPHGHKVERNFVSAQADYTLHSRVIEGPDSDGT
jgi:hypothetical protein